MLFFKFFGIFVIILQWNDLCTISTNRIMKNWIIKTLLTAVSVVFIAWLLPGITVEAGFISAIFVAIVLSLLNSTLKPILVVLTLPATILSLGLFMWVINAFIVMMADWWLGGFMVNNFWWALLFSALLSVVTSFLNKTFLPQQKTDNFTFTNKRTVIDNNVQVSQKGEKITIENGKKTIIIDKN